MRYTLCEHSKAQQQSQEIDESWDCMISRMATYRKRYRPPTKEHKEFCTPAIMPAIFPFGSPKYKDTAIGAELFGLDIDHAFDIPTAQTKLNGLNYLLYTTTNHTEQAHRFRVILPLTRFVTAAEWGDFWLGTFDYFGGAADGACRNINRLFYVPAQWGMTTQVFLSVTGAANLNVDTMILRQQAKQPQKPSTPSTPVDMKAAPASEVIITQNMIDAFRSSKKGGRFWALLTAAAARHKMNGWTLTGEDLCREARLVDDVANRPFPLREAERAIAWASENVNTQTALDKIKNRISFTTAMRGARYARR